MVFYHGTESRFLSGIKEGGGLKPSAVTGSRQGGRLQVHLTTDWQVRASTDILLGMKGVDLFREEFEVTRAPEGKRSWFYVEGTVPAKVLYIVETDRRPKAA